jgi:hypothetical protein
MRHSLSYLVVILLGCVVMSGCMVGDGTDSTDPAADDTAGVDTADLSPLAQESNRHRAFDYFVSKGLSMRQSAGIVGNLVQESGVNPQAIQFGGGPGRGIAQWSKGGRWDASSHDNVTWYAGTRGQSRWSLDTQLEFVWYELKTFSSYGLGELRACRWTGCSARAFEKAFERCGVCDEARRVEYARAVYAAYANSAMMTGDVDDVVVDGDEQRLDVEP